MVTLATAPLEGLRIPRPESWLYLEDNDIGPILAMIREKRGIDFTQYRDSTLRRRLDRRMLACDCNDLCSYAQQLECSSEELDRLVSDLTIKYSEFFRDGWVYDAIRDAVLPALIADKRPSNESIAIWSAGCATGEEAYSLAILARQMIVAGSCPTGVKIVGSDIDPLAIKAAEDGVYSKDFAPQMLEDRFICDFVDRGKKIAVSDEVKQLVSFHQHDLTAPTAALQMRKIWPGGFELILCRNVLVYLLRDAQSRVLSLCSEMLRPGGFLIIGTKEMIPRSMESDLIVVDKSSGLYRKVNADA